MSMTNYKMLEDDSFLDVTLSNNMMVGNKVGVQTISPAMADNHNQTKSTTLFARTELNGKRLVNNISEIQHSRATEEQLAEQSKMLATASIKGFGDCTRCKAWKRINQECRNLSGRSTLTNLDQIFKFIAELSMIESIKKMCPEFGRAIALVRDNLKPLYESELQDLTSKCFTLENKYKDTSDLAEKYKRDLDDV